jgi:rubrerythrin
MGDHASDTRPPDAENLEVKRFYMRRAAEKRQEQIVYDVTEKVLRRMRIMDTDTEGGGTDGTTDETTDPRFSDEGSSNAKLQHDKLRAMRHAAGQAGASSIMAEESRERHNAFKKWRLAENHDSDLQQPDAKRPYKGTPVGSHQYWRCQHCGECEGPQYGENCPRCGGDRVLQTVYQRR